MISLAIILPLLRPVKYRELEVEFAEEVKEFRKDVEAGLPPLPAGPSLQIRKKMRSSALSPFRRAPAVVEAWRLVESEARRALEARRTDGNGVPSHWSST